jgi:hypothetical protein
MFTGTVDPPWRIPWMLPVLLGGIALADATATPPRSRW